MLPSVAPLEAAETYKVMRHWAMDDSRYRRGYSGDKEKGRLSAALAPVLSVRPYGRSMVNAGDVHVSQCAGFAGSPSAFSSFNVIV